MPVIRWLRSVPWRLGAVLFLGVGTFARATPEFVEHIVANSVFGEPAGVTMREPDVPREDEAVDLWLRIGFSFYYTNIAIYYTTDGSTPAGSFGAGLGSTSVLTSASGSVTFVRNEPASPANIDWWKATLPAITRAYGTTIKYKVSAWHSAGGPEVFANNYGCADGVCDNPAGPATVFSYVVKLAWPGRGAPAADPGSGYPPVYFWKEEGVVGNNYINVQIDQNGTVYDIYYPSAGCVQGMGTRNEGYSDGLDTFPPLLPPKNRGQMNVNQLMPGIRAGGITYWLSNEAASGYGAVTQQYITDTNVIHTSGHLTAAGNSILVEQYDFCPKDIIYPLSLSGQPNRGLYVKRLILTNPTAISRTVNVYFYGDFALNGGDVYDAMFADAGRGALAAYDNVTRNTSVSGEYNPTSFSSYQKDVYVYLAAAMKLLGGVGGAGGMPATDSWRDTSGDNDQGWIGMQVVLPAGASREVDIGLVGGFLRNSPPNQPDNVYNDQVVPGLDWFLAQDMSQMQSATEGYWQNWLADGVTVDFPDDRYDTLFRRGLLATALHLDGHNGGCVAGMHNGAYPFVWPRDAVYAAISLARAGHGAEAREVYRFLRDVAFRTFDAALGGNGFWYQKYTTDGYQVWTAPQVDETAAVPWGAYYQYLSDADDAWLASNYTMVREAAIASSQTGSVNPANLNFNPSVNLMWSNNVWEDSYDFFIYSNASVERALRDAATVAAVLGNSSDASLFFGRAQTIHSGLITRLQQDSENTDISQLGIVYPFRVFGPADPLAAHLVDRVNGVAPGNFASDPFRPLVNFTNAYGWLDLIDRYWHDTYWGPGGAVTPWYGGPWFLTTLWYGLYYAERADLTPGKSDIDNHKYRIDLLFDRLGPLGLGAEQVAPYCGNNCGSLLYNNQTDFRLQAAWPNAWESMSTYVDAVMAFLDFVPNGPGDAFQIAPKLPSGWSSMSFNNLSVHGKRFSVTCGESATVMTQTFTNISGQALSYATIVRVPAGTTIFAVTQDNAPVAHSYSAAIGSVQLSGALNVGPGNLTTVRAYYGTRGDADGDGDIDLADYASFPGCMTGPGVIAAPICAVFDFGTDADIDLMDFSTLQRALVP